MSWRLQWKNVKCLESLPLLEGISYSR